MQLTQDTLRGAEKKGETYKKEELRKEMREEENERESKASINVQQVYVRVLSC